MPFRRRTRLITALLLLVSLVFMRMAVAAYVCPGATPQAADVSASATVAMPCGESMALVVDASQPNLCKAHCDAGRQSADTYKLPPLPDVALQAAVFPPVLLIGPSASQPLIQSPLLQRATSPPLAVRHCCFRI